MPPSSLRDRIALDVRREMAAAGLDIRSAAVVQLSKNIADRFGRQHRLAGTSISGPGFNLIGGGPGGGGGFPSSFPGSFPKFTPPSGGSSFCRLLPPGTARNICQGVTEVFPPGGGGGGGGGNLTPPDPCPNGVRIPGTNRCVNPGDLGPGGPPGFTGAGGQVVEGSFGLPGVTPVEELRTHRECPTGMVLGRDNICYPKAVLPRRSKFRKWKGAKRPPISVRDMNAIRRAARAKDRVKGLAKDVGFSCKKR